jgi:hypothetical protein
VPHHTCTSYSLSSDASVVRLFSEHHKPNIAKADIRRNLRLTAVKRQRRQETETWTCTSIVYRTNYHTESGQKDPWTNEGLNRLTRLKHLAMLPGVQDLVEEVYARSLKVM